VILELRQGMSSLSMRQVAMVRTHEGEVESLGKIPPGRLLCEHNNYGLHDFMCPVIKPRACFRPLFYTDCSFSCGVDNLANAKRAAVLQVGSDSARPDEPTVGETG
jgi:hypothetical protein